ncbi:hypothetical protein AAE478_008794 [Parahypoxylon ruwenzoriense]
MSGSYIPPFRRAEATTGDTPDGPQSPGAKSSLPLSPPSDRRFDNNEDTRGNYRGQGDRRVRGGRGRGSSRGYYGNRSYYPRDRQRQQVDDSELYSLHEIENHFWGPSQTEDDNGTYHHKSSSTFHDAEAHQGQLSYVLLFHGANTRWATDRIIFAKSRLELLPEYAAKKAEYGEWPLPQPLKSAQLPKAEETNTPGATSTTEDGPDADASSQPAAEVSNENDNARPVSTAADSSPIVEKENPEPPSPFPAIPPIDYVPSAPFHPIAAFEEHRRYSPYGDTSFAFAGWYKIVRINVLAPRSAELVRMQHQKWERRDRWGNVVGGKGGARDTAGWNAALAREWAVVKFEKLPDGGNGNENEGGDGQERQQQQQVAPPAPVIERLSPPQRKTEQKSAQVEAHKGDVGIENKAEPLRDIVELTSAMSVKPDDEKEETTAGSDDKGLSPRDLVVRGGAACA